VSKNKKITILDTTLRDGEQTPGVSFTSREKLIIAKSLLTEVGVNIVEATSARVSEGELNTIRDLCGWAQSEGFIDSIEILGFVDINRSADWIISGGGRVMNLLTKGSKRHLSMQLKKTPQEHITDIEKTVDYATDHGMIVNVYLEDYSSGMRALVNNSDEYITDIISAISAMKVNRIMLPDTLGILSPAETKRYIKIIVEKFPAHEFDFHAHNDYGLATANTIAAIESGACCVHTTVNGLGERAGNAPLAEVVAAVHDHLNLKTSVSEKELFRISEIVEAYSGERVSHNKPVMGDYVFTQTAGIHADGDKKGDLYANLLTPARFGREREYALGKLSGGASIEHNLKKLGIELESGEMKALLKRVIELGDRKETVTVEDLPFIIADVLDTPQERKIEIKSCLVASGKGVTPTASFILKYEGEVIKEGASGDGGYDAFMNALRSASKKISLELPKLVDYEVRIPPGGRTDAIVETKITWQSGKTRFNTTGVDTDQVMAAVKATEKMLNLITTDSFLRNKK